MLVTLEDSWLLHYRVDHLLQRIIPVALYKWNMVADSADRVDAAFWNC